MVQFVIEDTEEKKFWRIFQGTAQQTFDDLKKYYENAYSSPELGRVLYEQQLLPIYKVLEKKLFVKAFAEIVDGEKNLGTIEAYLKILYAIFGNEAKITVTSMPLHLLIDIVAPIQKFYLWTTKDNKQVITKDGKALKLKQLLAEVTNRQLFSILQATTNAGTFVEFTLNKEGKI